MCVGGTSSARAPVQGCSELLGFAFAPTAHFSALGKRSADEGDVPTSRPLGAIAASGVGNDLSDRLLPTEAIERLGAGVASRSTLPSADALYWMRATECRWSSIASVAVVALRVTTPANVFRWVRPTEDLGRQSQRAPSAGGAKGVLRRAPARCHQNRAGRSGRHPQLRRLARSPMPSACLCGRLPTFARPNRRPELRVHLRRRFEYGGHVRVEHDGDGGPSHTRRKSIRLHARMSNLHSGERRRHRLPECACESFSSRYEKNCRSSSRTAVSFSCRTAQSLLTINVE